MTEAASAPTSASGEQANLANYETEWSAAEYTRDRGLWAHEAALIERFFPKPPARVLDLGCGAGRTSIGLAEKGYETVAIDLSDQLLRLARERFPQVDFRKMDATALAFPDASFDAAIFSYNGIDCIEPVAARLQCMREVWRVLKPGAPFLLSSHNFVGSLFSGGFLYLRGHLNALKSMADQLGNRKILQWFARYRDGGGDQFLYSAPPGHTADQLRRSGFTVEAVEGHDRETRPWRVFLHRQHVNFAARKPG